MSNIATALTATEPTCLEDLANLRRMAMNKTPFVKLLVIAMRVCALEHRVSTFQASQQQRPKRWEEKSALLTEARKKLL